ncbi:Uncharacterised protein [Mycobacteroides abscessus subsp. massiliense]|nr:Uncharacterised protein [Mycobacteroides abscessus subsp. massiliense]
MRTWYVRTADSPEVAVLVTGLWYVPAFRWISAPTGTASAGTIPNVPALPPIVDAADGVDTYPRQPARAEPRTGDSRFHDRLTQGRQDGETDQRDNDRERDIAPGGAVAQGSHPLGNAPPYRQSLDPTGWPSALAS